MRFSLALMLLGIASIASLLIVRSSAEAISRQMQKQNKAAAAEKTKWWTFLDKVKGSEGEHHLRSGWH